MCGTTNTNLFAKITFLKNIPQLGVETIKALIPGGLFELNFPEYVPLASQNP